MITIPVPGTDAVLEIDEEKLAAIEPRKVMEDLPDLVPYSGENFGKPTLKGD